MTMIINRTPSQILCTGYMYAIPFFQKKNWGARTPRKKLFEKYNWYFFPKKHHFFLKFSKKIQIYRKNYGKFEFFLKISRKNGVFLEKNTNCIFQIIFFLGVRAPNVFFERKVLRRGNLYTKSERVSG